ncbi:hypothetical protein A3A67_00895 [Candidatus Peribacteria bacterium RIFCSPLOWO2_01_FULL_51_18]|nr:MAG: hypothetical protein A3C52_01485 [Candidatus Peribacteria bacterium RIFCSPHIGHO2_02_FULL_51_15]OGJ65859.1 MAG: hypothetical protein A3A67_00895 [Candidatus Peribacteria bacterium RIFCSPLOWO2_01_FULL_51_18]
MTALHALYPFPFFFGHHSLELVEFGEVDRLTALFEDAVVDRVGEVAVEFLHGHFLLPTLTHGFTLQDAPVPVHIDLRDDPALTRPFQPHLPRLLHDGEVHRFGMIETRLIVTKVASLVRTTRLALFERVHVAAPHIGREFVGVVLRKREADTEHHLAVRIVRKRERDELQVEELAVVDQLNDLTALHHVSGKAIRMPCDDAIDLTSLDHLLELLPTVRLLR